MVYRRLWAPRRNRAGIPWEQAATATKSFRQIRRRLKVRFSLASAAPSASKIGRQCGHACPHSPRSMYPWGRESEADARRQGSAPIATGQREAAPMSANFSQQVLRGAAWSYGGQIVTTLGHFILGVILARLLGPSEFGVFIAVTAFTSLFLMGVQFGMPQAILQAKTLTESQINAAFWSICTLALVFIGLTVAVAAPLAGLYASDQFEGVMYAMCSVFALTPFTAVGLALLRREMRFDRVELINVVSLVVSALLSIAAALVGAGVYSLVVGAVSGMVVNLGILLLSIDWRPSWPRWSPVRPLLGYSGFAALNTMLIFATARVDSMLVGAMLGTSQLGLYNRSYSLARIPSDQFAESLGPLVLGSLSRIQDDVERSRQLYFKAVAAISTLTMPFLVVLGVAGPGAIDFLYGEAWLGAGGPLRVMVIGAVFVMLSSSLKGFINAQGLVREAVPLFATVLAATVIFVLALADWGLVAIAIGISLREGLLFVMMVRLLGRSQVRLRLSEIGYAVAPAMIASLVALLVGLGSLAAAPVALTENAFIFLLSIGLSITAAYGFTMLLLMLTWRSHLPLRSTRQLLPDRLAIGRRP